MLYLFLFVFTQCANIKTKSDFKVPQITATYAVQCANIYTYYLEQSSSINIEGEFSAERTDISHISAADIQGMSADTSIRFECPVVLKQGPIMATTLHQEFGFAQTWTILHHDDFESRSSLVGWNVPHRAYCSLKQVHYGESQGSDHFIQTSCHQQQLSLNKTFTTSLVHHHIRVTAELSLFGDWNGDSITLLIDNKIAWQKVFHTDDFEHDLQHRCPSLTALSVPVQAIIEHQDPVVPISFQATQMRHPCDGSFGVDDLIIYYK